MWYDSRLSLYLCAMCVKCPSTVEHYNCVDDVDHDVFINT